jgi:hypothetical protein
VRLGNGEGKSGGDMWDLEYVEGVKGRKSEVYEFKHPNTE